MLEDNLGLTIIDIQDERGVDLDVYRLRRRFIKAPSELSSHQHVMIVQPGLIQGQDLCGSVTVRFKEFLSFVESCKNRHFLGNACATRAGKHD